MNRPPPPKEIIVAQYPDGVRLDCTLGTAAVLQQHVKGIRIYRYTLAGEETPTKGQER